MTNITNNQLSEILVEDDIKESDAFESGLLSSEEDLDDEGIEIIHENERDKADEYNQSYCDNFDWMLDDDGL